jgi:hypothetical protein
VMAARSSAMSTISATLWRGMRSYTVTVDQPYDIPDCSVDDPSCWRSRCAEGKTPPPASSESAHAPKKPRKGAKR